MRTLLHHSVPALLTTVLVLGVGLTGCTSPGAAAPATTAPATSAASACEGVVTMLTTDDPRPHAGDAVAVSITPSDCPVDEQWAGEVVVRTDGSDTPTGTRFEIGETTVSVDLPVGVSGAAKLMLVPDLNCEGGGATADCHYPSAEIEILP